MKLRLFAWSATVTAAVALAGSVPAQSADYYDHGRYDERYYEHPVPVFPQRFHDREEPREYRVIVYPVKRHRTYDHGYDHDRYRGPHYPNAHSSGYDHGPLPYGPSGYGDRVYDQGYRDGFTDADRRYGAYGRASFEAGPPLPPALVGSPRRGWQ